MKKIFTLAAAVLASFSLWAAEPNYGSYDWGADDFATVFTNHDGIVLSSDASAWKGNFSGIQYVALGGGTDMSASSPTPYFGITADAPIDSIEVFWAPNGSNNTSVAWAGWEEASQLLNQTVVAMGKTETYAASKSYDAAIWQKIDLSGYDFKAVMLARQIKKAIIGDQQQSNLGDNQTVNILGIRVWVRETKEIDHVVETLTGAAIDGVALDETEMTTLLIGGAFEDPTNYVEAPTVTFTVQTDTYYVGETEPSTKSEDIDVVAALNPDGKWQAQQTVGEYTYTITAVKPATATVTYMDGETVLGEEIVKVGESATKYGEYEVKPLAEFQGWYTDAELTSEADLSATVSADQTLYGKFVKAYASSLNIEQLVLDEGTKADIASILTNHGFAYSNINALDSLNDDPSKTNRNYAFLGLKIKKQGGYIACNVQAGQTIRVKFGNVAAAVKAYANDQEMTLTPVDKALDVLEFSATEETFVKLETTTDGTVVIKQIMIDEQIAEVVLPDPLPTGINNAEEAVKAVKVVRNGQLFIEKNGVIYNAQGAVVK